MTYEYFTSRVTADNRVREHIAAGRMAYRVSTRTMGQYEVRSWESY